MSETTFDRSRRMVAASALGAALGASISSKSSFIGVWRLESCVRKHSDGRMEYPFGEQPIGRLTYDRAGRMSAQAIRPGRRSTMPPGVDLINGKAPEAEIRDALTGFVSYFGTFDVEENSQTVIHHVQAALVPSWIGTDLKRKYRFDAGRLILTGATPVQTDELVWVRESD